MSKKNAGGAAPPHPLDFELHCTWPDGGPVWTRLTLDIARTLPRNTLMYTDNEQCQYKNTLCRFRGRHDNAPDSNVMDVLFGAAPETVSKRLKLTSFLILNQMLKGKTVEECDVSALNMRVSPAAGKVGFTGEVFEKANPDAVKVCALIPPLLPALKKDAHAVKYHRTGSDLIPAVTAAIAQFGCKDHDHYNTPDNVKSWFSQKTGKPFEQWFDPYPPAIDAPKNADGSIRDALKIEWKSHNYVNPPWGADCMEKAVAKAYREKLKGKTTWMLAPMNISTKWFKTAMRNNLFDKIEYYDGDDKVRFIHQSSGEEMNSRYHEFFFLLFLPDSNTPVEVAEKRVKEVQLDLPRTISFEEFESMKTEYDINYPDVDSDDVQLSQELVNLVRDSLDLDEIEVSAYDIVPQPEPVDLQKVASKDSLFDSLPAVNEDDEFYEGRCNICGEKADTWDLIDDSGQVSPACFNCSTEYQRVNLTTDEEPGTPEVKREVAVGDCLVCQSNKKKYKGKSGIVVNVGKEQTTCKVITSEGVMLPDEMFKHSNKKPPKFDDGMRDIYEERNKTVEDKKLEVALKQEEAVIKKLDDQLSAAAEPEPEVVQGECEIDMHLISFLENPVFLNSGVILKNII